MEEQKNKSRKEAESDIQSLIEQLYAPYSDDNADEPWYRGDEVSEHEDWEIESKLDKAVDASFRYVGDAQGVISGGGIGWAVRESYWVWPEPIEDGTTWVLYGLWFDDNWNRWAFNQAEQVTLKDASFELAAYELLKMVRPNLDDDGDGKKVDTQVEGWRRLSLGLSRTPRTLGPFVERKYRNHGPFMRRADAEQGNQEFDEADWRMLTQLGYALAKSDAMLHPGEDREVMRWWKGVAKGVLNAFGEKNVYPLARMMSDWEARGELKPEDLEHRFTGMSKDKGTRLCQMMYQLALVDGNLASEEMAMIQSFAKGLSVSLFDVGKDSAVPGALRDLLKMEEIKGDAKALRQFSPTWLFLPMPILSPLTRKLYRFEEVGRNEMAVGWMALEYQPAYWLMLILGSDEEGCYLRAEDSLLVTWPERKISTKVSMDEVMDFLIRQPGALVEYPHEDAQQPERSPIPSPLTWMLGSVGNQDVSLGRDRGVDVVSCQSNLTPFESQSSSVNAARAALGKSHAASNSGGRLNVMVNSEFWPLADALSVCLRGDWGVWSGFDS